MKTAKKTTIETKNSKRQHASVIRNGSGEPDWDFSNKPPMPKSPALMTKEEKDAELSAIAKEINEQEEKIQDNEQKARTILFDSIHRSRKIGDRLNRAKALLPHGEYQDWVLHNFAGSPATARAYKRISDNWSKLSARLGDFPGQPMSIREALEWLAENKGEFKHDRQSLLGKFERLIDEWPAEMIDSLVVDENFIRNLDALCRKFFRKKQMEETKSDGGGNPLTLMFKIVPKKAAA